MPARKKKAVTASPKPKAVKPEIARPEAVKPEVPAPPRPVVSPRLTRDEVYGALAGAHTRAVAQALADYHELISKRG